MLPTVSICVTAWNQLDHSKNCLEGISIAADIPFEVIVVNNDSQDGTREWLDQFAEGVLSKNPNFIKLTLLHLPENRYITGGKNTGFSHAIGKYLCFICNDLLLPPKFLSYAVSYLARHPENGVISPYYIEDPRWYGAENYYKNYYEKMPRSNEWIKEWHHSVLEVMTRECWDLTGPLDEKFRNHQMDVDWGRRVSLAGFHPITYKGFTSYHHRGSLARKSIPQERKVAEVDSIYFRQKWGGVDSDRGIEFVPDEIKKIAAKGNYISEEQKNYQIKWEKVIAETGV